MKTLVPMIVAVLSVTLGLQTAVGADALGSSAAFDSRGRLWVVYTEPADGGSQMKLMRSDDRGAAWSAPLAITGSPEPISADGENRPKLAFGDGGEIYVTWTSPTSARYTGDIRFTRSLDEGRTWAPPLVVHRDRQLIAHRFESLAVDARGRVWVAWIDKRDLEQAQAARRDYSGAAIYYAYSDDRGASWRGDFKLADHSCECCRIALARDERGQIGALWRHVFDPNERDHAFALLDEQGASRITRATFDRWRIDACPHHGPGLAFSEDGARHAVWFNQSESVGRVFYGRLTDSAPTSVQALPAGAQHADVAANGRAVAIAWKRFDGEATRVETWLSQDGGRSFHSGPFQSTQGASDQPRLLRAPDGDIVLVWRVADRFIVRSLSGADALSDSREPAQQTLSGLRASHGSTVLPFGRDTLAQIEARMRGEPFWLVLWDLECSYCMQSLRALAQAQAQSPALRAVTISTDSITQAAEIAERLTSLGVRSESYAFGQDSSEALRHAIDAGWAGEKPRAYRYDARGEREAVSGVVNAEDYRP